VGVSVVKANAFFEGGELGGGALGLSKFEEEGGFLV
jgi:hypothetical protein